MEDQKHSTQGRRPVPSGSETQWPTLHTENRKKAAGNTSSAKSKSAGVPGQQKASRPSGAGSGQKKASRPSGTDSGQKKASRPSGTASGQQKASDRLSRTSDRFRTKNKHTKGKHVSGKADRNFRRKPPVQPAARILFLLGPAVFLPLAFLYLELIFHIYMGLSLKYMPVYCFFAVAAGLLFSLLSSFFRQKINFRVTCVVTSIFSLLFYVEILCKYILQQYYQLLSTA